MSRTEQQMVFTRRFYLLMMAIRGGAESYAEAIEAVSTTALSHPEWDMAETKTWAEWEAQG